MPSPSCNARSASSQIPANWLTGNSDTDRPWLTGRVPDGYWHSRPNRLHYLDWLGRRLGFVAPDDWYRLRNIHFIHNHGSTLLQKIYGSSVQTAMRDFLPGRDWIPWLFASTPRGFWKEARNRREYMTWLEQRIGITSPEDWYGVSLAVFAEHGGSGLLVNYFQGSLLSALHEYLPTYDWKPWLFSKVPNGFWTLPNNRRRYFEWLADRYGLHGLDDWKALTRRAIHDSSGATLLCDQYAGSLGRLIEDVVAMELVPQE